MDGGPQEPIVPRREKRERFPVITGPIIQRAMKRGWQLLKEGKDGAEFRNPSLVVGKKTRDVHVIVSVSREMDGRVWVHLSVSVIFRKMGIETPSYEVVVLPAWSTVCVARDDFLGPEAKAVMVLAPKSEHVNIEDVHHIWHCPEGEGLPDFTRGTGSI